MKITQNTGECKPLNSASAIFFSNSISIPQIWYYKVLVKTGKPDHVGITILSELLRLHVASGEALCEFQLSYPKFKSRFNYSYDQVYEGLVRLDNQSLITRRGKLLVLNIKKLAELTTNNTKDLSLNIDLDIDEDNYDNKEWEGRNPTSDKPQGIIQTAKKLVKSFIRQPLSSFYPLSEEDAKSLRCSSGREFNLAFMNQLVLKLADKYPEHGFYKKELFMKYMTEILSRELRQAVNVNNEGFRFRQTDGAAVAEEYLSKVESDLSNKPSEQMRRKVAAKFEPVVAYKILTSCYFPEAPCEGRYEIKQRLPLELSKQQQEQLYSQVSAVFGDRLESIKIVQTFKSVAKPQHSSTLKEQRTLAFSFPLDTSTLWGRVRDSLIKQYGEAIDNSWFSKLETAEDLSSRKLVLKGTSFLTSYIQTNYAHVIQKLCNDEGYEFKFA
jgi:hypothetical protein